MTLSRRRFLSISAAVAMTPASAFAESWQCRAFGADLSMTIRGPKEQAGPAMSKARAALSELEGLFSLYDANSALTNLNLTGSIQVPDVRFVDLMRAADEAYELTGGLFDPTVQPLWRALSNGEDLTAAIASIDWSRVQYDAKQISLGVGQALTFNGIAQGFATDVVAEILAEHGLTDVLVNIGEYRCAGGPWRLALEDPTHGTLGTRTLTSGAIATSSPMATSLRGQGHILHASVRPVWSTVSVEAASATLADSLSTAMVLAPLDQVREIRNKAGITRVTLVDGNGDLITI